MKIVHFADVHLDAPFAWCEATGDVARRRREALRDSLLAIVSLARETGADALLCGGDLYEHDRVTLDTGSFLRETFADLDPVRVYIAPGNHDWYGPESLYATVDWSNNVHIFREAALRPVSLGSSVTLWAPRTASPRTRTTSSEGTSAQKVRGATSHCFTARSTLGSLRRRRARYRMPRSLQRRYRRPASTTPSWGTITSPWTATIIPILETPILCSSARPVNAVPWWPKSARTGWWNGNAMSWR